MRPLRRGATRSALATGLSNLLHKVEYGKAEASVSDMKLAKQANLQAAIVGGAIVQTCKDMGIDEEIFFRYTNENVWRLTRALEASNLLEKAGES